MGSWVLGIQHGVRFGAGETGHWSVVTGFGIISEENFCDDVPCMGILEAVDILEVLENSCQDPWVIFCCDFIEREGEMRVFCRKRS